MLESAYHIVFIGFSAVGAIWGVSKVAFELGKVINFKAVFENLIANRAKELGDQIQHVNSDLQSSKATVGVEQQILLKRIENLEQELRDFRNKV